MEYVQEREKEVEKEILRKQKFLTILTVKDVYKRLHKLELKYCNKHYCLIDRAFKLIFMIYSIIFTFTI